tara:strand:+ start:16976 stop:17368 length:393 start_codon:yes stop_codon:yes gene_type:complete
MKKIEVHSLPLYEVIRDIADAFKVKFKENCGEYHVNVPKRLGEGYIKGINFDGGFGILIYDCTFKEDIEFHFVVNDIHPLKFLYCLKEYCTTDSKTTRPITPYSNTKVRLLPVRVLMATYFISRPILKYK